MSDNKIKQAEQEMLSLSKKVYSIAYHYTGNHHDARDLTQEAYIKMLIAIRRKNFNLEKSLKAYFFTIVRNIYIDFIKKESKIKTITIDADPFPDSNKSIELEASSDYNPENIIEKKLMHDKLTKALNTIDKHFRMPLILSDKQGLSYNEISRMLKIPVGTVRSRIHRGRIQLARILSKEDIL